MADRSVVRSPLSRALWRMGLPLVWLTVVFVCAFGADVMPFPPPSDMDFAAAEQGPSMAHPLGADLDGRDVLSRLAHGARISLTVSLLAPLIGLVIGTVLGLLSAYYTGVVRTGILAVLDAMLAFPSLVFALALTVVLGPSVQNVTLALGIMSVPAFARIARANALPLMSREFVLAARTAGASDAYIMFREILPNMVMSLLTYALTMMSIMIVAEGSLSFLGVGVPPPTPSWGSMIAEGRESLERVPHVSMIPAAAMFLTVLSLNLLGDSLRQLKSGKSGGLS
ncbi:ABC transporter permease [Variovorax sp. LT1P1]|uniref:ABC transporter permease n=1 Tax=Variovorax sp. LT1P1 TaxID=3443730 RepID=UPI003F44676C